MELDGVGRGPGGKRVENLIDKLSAGGAASEGKHTIFKYRGIARGRTLPSKNIPQARRLALPLVQPEGWG